MNKQFKFVFPTIIVIFVPILLFGQNDSLKHKTINTKVKYYDYSEFKNENKFGYDSLGRKQGVWSEVNDQDYLIFLPDSNTIPPDNSIIIANGFYVNNKREGFWDLYTIDSTREKNLFAQVFYQCDTMILQVTYKDSKIAQITRIGFKSRKGNSQIVGVNYEKDRIAFDNNGYPIYRESYTPDGLLEKTRYIKPKEKQKNKQRIKK